MNKFLILLFYYNRPRLVREALASIRESTYKNWELAVIDDGSDVPIEDILINCLSNEELLNTKVYSTGQTKEEKIAQGGSIFGKYANNAMLESNADICFMVCDDDCITPWYMEQLNSFYIQNPSIMYSYCDVITMNPIEDFWRDKLVEPASPHFLNANHNPHSMGNSKDSSQGSWRMECVRGGGLRFPFPRTVALDYVLWEDLNRVYGPGHFNGTIGAVKSYWSHQLGNTGSYDNPEGST